MKNIQKIIGFTLGALLLTILPLAAVPAESLPERSGSVFLVGAALSDSAERNDPNEKPSIFYNGMQIELPFLEIKDGSLFGDPTPLLDMIGASPKWDAASGTYEARFFYGRVKFVKDSNTYTNEYGQAALRVAPYVKNGVLYVPFKELFDSLSSSDEFSLMAINNPGGLYFEIDSSRFLLAYWMWVRELEDGMGEKLILMPENAFRHYRYTEDTTAAVQSVYTQGERTVYGNKMRVADIRIGEFDIDYAYTQTGTGADREYKFAFGLEDGEPLFFLTDEAENTAKYRFMPGE